MFVDMDERLVEFFEKNKCIAQEKIKNRQDANRELLKMLSEYIEKCQGSVRLSDCRRIDG